MSTVDGFAGSKVRGNKVAEEGGNVVACGVICAGIGVGLLEGCPILLVMLEGRNVCAAGMVWVFKIVGNVVVACCGVGDAAGIRRGWGNLTED